MIGFSDKASFLLQEILKQLPAAPPTPDQFEIMKIRLSKDLANSSIDLAVIQAIDLAHSLLYQNNPTKAQQLEALQSITYDDFCAFLHVLLSKTYTEAIFCGNLSLKDAESAWLDIHNLLDSAPYPKDQHSICCFSAWREYSFCRR